MTRVQQILEWYTHFHTHAEVSWKEIKTTNKLAQIMDELGVRYQTFDDVTGLVAEIGQGEEVIAIRADIDALWQEVNGAYQANHSCGHDANMAMVLGALAELKDEDFQKTIRFIFQPAEEKGNGANAMIDRGAVDGVTHLFGVHLRPAEELDFGKFSPAIHHGAAMFLKGKIHGVDAHGARPHQGKNAIDVIVAIHQMLNTIYYSPFEAYSVKLTNIHAGGESLNIIPGQASFAIDARAQKNEVLHQMKEQLERKLRAVGQQFDVTIDWEWQDITPGAEVADEAANLAREGILDSVGDEALEPEVHTSGSDDFHCYTVRRPDLKAAMIGVGAGMTHGLHHPDMSFDTSILPEASRVLAQVLRHATK
ncbi:amidohydrolase [Chryseomicrobium aureum]|uniref:amidohydrolase n=1 Tax=Chryseomicrobium aureum TaxID=1441723 RepID=UPI00195D6896|nr:amidohydrolase [Chryseomicrobium aureum]MBM7706249.1 amidohydrolase [Chryseomicrobium aureum]